MRQAARQIASAQPAVVAVAKPCTGQCSPFMRAKAAAYAVTRLMMDPQAIARMGAVASDHAHPSRRYGLHSSRRVAATRRNQSPRRSSTNETVRMRIFTSSQSDQLAP